MIQPSVHPLHLVTRGLSVREAVQAERHLLTRHYGPGSHPGTGTEQEVHGGEGGGAPESDKDREKRLVEEQVWERHRKEEHERSSDEIRKLQFAGLRKGDDKDVPPEIREQGDVIQSAYSFDIFPWEVRPVALYSIRHKKMMAELEGKGVTGTEANRQATRALAEKYPQLHLLAVESVQRWNKWEKTVQQAVAEAEQRGLQPGQYQISPYTGLIYDDEEKKK